MNLSLITILWGIYLGHGKQIQKNTLFLIRKSNCLTNSEDAHKKKKQRGADSRCISVIWSQDQMEWYNAKKSQANWFSPFTSPFSLPLDFFYEFSKTLQSWQISKDSKIEKDQVKHLINLCHNIYNFNWMIRIFISFFFILNLNVGSSSESYT